MTPELLREYLKTFKDMEVGSFRLRDGTVWIEGAFLPPEIPEFKGESTTPGGWKSPTSLDVITELTSELP